MKTCRPLAALVTCLAGSLAALVTCLTGSLAAQGLGLKLANSATTPLYVEVPYSQTLHPAAGITVESWVTYDDASLTTGWKWPTVARQNQVAQREAWYLRVDAAQTANRVLTFKVRTQNSGFVSASYAFAVGEFKNWAHVAGTYDGSNVRMYINGVLKATTPGTGPIVDDGNVAGNTLQIGTGAVVQNAPTIEIWNGEIDEFRVWPFARNAAEIQATMNMQLQSVPGEVSTWNLNFTGTDSSGNNNGKLVNNPVFAPNTLRLTAAALTGSGAFGQNSSACSASPLAGITSAPNLGNQAFGLSSVRGPGQGKGLLWIGLGKLSSPVDIGARIWVDTSLPGLVLGVAPAAGATRVPAPLPNNLALAGATVHCQFLWEDLGCTTPLSATAGLTLQVVQ